MAEEKMGTQYAREIAEMFKETAGGCKFPDVKEKLLSLAKELETQAPKLYMKTQKGTEDMKALSQELANFKNTLTVCQDVAAAQSFCVPMFTKLEQMIQHVKNFKVRMT
jgi:hypothetical protein